jgi:redox-sensitive bicupin YhaK (pirin superfamily)
MTAGRGIVHSEMPEQKDGLLAGYQLWINLPAAHKMTQPAYQEHDAARIPVETRAGARVRVITGTTSQGTAGPVAQPLTEPLYLDVALQPGARFEETLPNLHTAFIQVIEGEIAIIADAQSNTVRRDQLAVLGGGDRVIVQADAQPGRFLLVAGKPLKEPIARAGPFVMNTETELRQAFSDYQSGRF